MGCCMHMQVREQWHGRGPQAGRVQGLTPRHSQRQAIFFHSDVCLALTSL